VTQVTLKLAAEGSMACNRKAGVRRNAGEAAGRAHSRRRCRIACNRRQKVLKDIREAVSDRV
jgi:hypothetical protein